MPRISHKAEDPCSFDNDIPYRPRLRDMLKAAVEKPLTLVMADVGFGKTQAVSSLFDDPSCRVIWVQLTKLDNLVSRLWEQFSRAVENYSKPLSSDLRSLNFPESLADYDRMMNLARAAIEKAGNEKRYILVFDDLHLIKDPHALEFIEFVSNTDFDRVSVVLISNEQLTLDYATHRTADAYTVITHEDLRLTPDEIKQYYLANNITLTDEAAAELYEWTSGWAFAVYLMGRSLREGETFGKEIYSKGILDIYAMIESCVYLPLSAQARRFLIKLAVLDSIPQALIKPLANNRIDIIEEVEHRHGMLLHFDRGSGRYRLMNLFRMFLLEKHDDLSQKEKRAINLEAAVWNRQHGEWIDSISFYVAGGDYLSAFDIIITHTQRLPREIAAFFINTIDNAPAEALQAFPVILAARVRFLINNRQTDMANQSLSELRHTYEHMNPSPLRNEMLGEIYALYGVLGLVSKTMDFVEFFIRADTLLPNGSRILNKNLALVGGASLINTRHLRRGSVKEYVEALFHGMPYAFNVMRGCGAGLEYLVAAEADYITGDIKEAEKNLFAALYRAQTHEQYDIEYMAYALLLRIAVFQGDYHRASVAMETVRQCFKRNQTPDCNALCDVTVSGFFAAIGKADKIARWILGDAGKTRAQAVAPISLHVGQKVRARYLLHLGRYNELLAYVDQLDDLYTITRSLPGLIDDAILRAIASYYLDNKQQAFEALKNAYLLSYENDIITPFVEYGKWMRTLTRAAKLNKNSGIPLKWLDTVLTKSSTYAKRLSVITNAYELDSGDKKAAVSLSKREKDVLTGMCQGLTREEIAQAYQISANTVKAMLPIVYDKLGAVNSLDAVRIATSLSII